MTDLTDDQTALRQFVQERSGAAFDAIVRRHADWVYSAALRQVHDPAAAEDVAQAAFILLARKAAQLTEETHLSGWLFKVVRYQSLFLERSRRRRQAHERAAAMAQRQSQGSASHGAAWEEISPVLDEAVAKLTDADRKCILLRFYEQLSFAGVGEALNTSEDAARKRVERAVAKLRHILARRGVESRAMDLSALMIGGLVHPAPLSIVGGAALTGHAAGPGAMNLAAHANRALVYARLKIAAWLLGAAGLLTGAVAAHAVLFADGTPPPAVQPARANAAPVSAGVVAPQPPANTPAPVQLAITTDTFLGRIIDPSGHPVAGATIWPVDDHIQPADRKDTKLGAPTQSAADGTFSLTVTQPVPGGNYAPTVGVVVHADNFAWAGGRLAGPRPVDIELPLPIGLRAVFVDPDGSPVQGLAVDVDGMKSSDDEIDTLVRMNADFSNKFLRVTDASGAVEWTDLPRLYTVNLNWTDPRFVQPSDEATAFLPNALGAPDMTIQLKAASTIRGRIIYGHTHQPATQVRIRTVGEAKDGRGMTIVNSDAMTDADGNYALTQLLPATYSVFLNDPALQRNWTAPAISPTLGQSQTLDGQDFILQKGGVITGTVTDVTTGASLKGAYLSVQGPSQPNGSQYDQTDAAGQYTLHVSPGKQRLTFGSGPQYYVLTSSHVTHELHVADGETVTVNFQMKHVEPTSTEFGRGKVIFADGTPAPGARLIYECADGHRQFTRTNLDGEFPFTSNDTPDGHFFLWASLGLLRSHPITDTNHGEFTLTLLPNLSGPLTGRVVDENGQPIEGAVVIARKMPGYNDAGIRSTGPDGTFLFQRISPDWDYRIQVNALGHRSMSKTIRPMNGNFAPLEFKMQIAATAGTGR